MASEYLGSLPTHTLKQLSEKRITPLAVRVFSVTAIYATSALVALHGDYWMAWILAWFVQGLIIAGITGLLHECIHNHFTSSRRMNRMVGAVFAAILLKNFTLHKYFHLQHHSFTSRVGDPENYPRIECVGGYFLRMYRTMCKGFFRQRWKVVVNSALGKFPDYAQGERRHRETRQDCIVQCLWIAAVITTLVWKPILTCAFYLIPLLVYYPIAFFLMLPEHFETFSGNDARSNTRTIESNAMLRFF